MDGQRFDQLARAFAKGASRRQVLQGLVAGAVGGALAQLRPQSAHAQCTWSGTFEAPFGGSITMTLNEVGGQVSGTYTFTQENAVRNGSITGIVRTDYPGYTVLDGYWREPGEGGRIWFSMPLDTCSQFTGSYTGTDDSTAWTAGWDGLRTGGEGGGGDVEVTLYSNPGDSRAATSIIEGHPITLFGPKDANGGVEYINQALIDSPDGDPQKRVFLEFDAAGTPTRAALASGETMHFAWASPTRAIITYQSADGSQEVQFPYEADPAAADGIATDGRGTTTLAQGNAEVRLLTYSGHSHPAWTLTERRAASPSAQPLGNPGTIEVQCGAGQLVAGAIVTGAMAPANTPGTQLEVSFTETSPGVFTYSLPIAPAPAPLEGFHKTRLQRALLILCAGNAAIFITQTAGNSICAYILGIPAVGTPGFATCLLFINSYRLLCLLNTTRMIGGAAVDFFAGSFEVTARAQHPKLGTKEIRFNAAAGSAIPRGVIQFAGAAGIGEITTAPPDPGPSEGYEIRVGTVCAASGSQLTVSVAGTDNFTTSTSVTISETVTEATLPVPGGAQGIQDTITVQLTGAVSDSKDKTIVF